MKKKEIKVCIYESNKTNVKKFKVNKFSIRTKTEKHVINKAMS